MASQFVSMSASIGGIDALFSAAAVQATQQARTAFLEKAAGVVERRAKQLVPPADHRSAELRRNIQHQVDADKGEARVGNDLKYAAYVHGYFDETKTRTKPHWVPQSAMVALGEWAATHGITDGGTYAGGKTFAQGGRRRTGGRQVVADQNLRMGRRIAAGIARRGTPINPYLKNALEQSKGEIDRLAEQMAADIAKAAGGRS